MARRKTDAHVQWTADGVCRYFASWSKSLEIRLLSFWFLAIWLLSFVHLIEGLANIQVLSILSYTLYSMALHAYTYPCSSCWSSGQSLNIIDDRG